MAKVNFCTLAEISGGVVDSDDNGRLVIVVETKDEVREYDVLDLFQKLVGYEINIKATLPTGE